MKDQPLDLNQTWPEGRKWCVDLQMPPKIWGSPKFGAQKTSNFEPLFPRLSHSTPHISGTKRRTDKQKCVNPQCVPYKVTYFPSMAFDPETAEIRLLILTHPSAAITSQTS